MVGLPVVLSTGGAIEDDVIKAWVLLRAHSNAILHCTSLYPCPPEHLNLQAIKTLRARLPDTVIGFSDHQDGIDLAAVAYMRGARIFENPPT